jgi:hypothetical protein
MSLHTVRLIHTCELVKVCFQKEGMWSDASCFVHRLAGPLHIAASNGHDVVVWMLLAAVANKEALQKVCVTVLIL